MNLLGISGKIGSGKDAVASIINKYSKYPWEVKKYAYKLKQVAGLILGVDPEKFEDQEFKKTLLPEAWHYYKVSWANGDEGAGSAKFGTREEAIKFMEDTLEDGADESLLSFHQPTVREFLQKLGTEAVRDVIHPNTWVNALMSEYKSHKVPADSSVCIWGDSYRHRTLYPNGAVDIVGVTPETNPELFKDKYPNWIITDCRFPNEAQAIKDKGGIIIRIERGEPVNENDHLTETALLGWNFDYVINNNGTMEELEDKVIDILDKLEVMIEVPVSKWKFENCTFGFDEEAKKSKDVMNWRASQNVMDHAAKHDKSSYGDS